MVSLPLDRTKKLPVFMLCSMRSHHREGRADLTSLLNAEQREVLQLSLKTVVNLEKQETSCAASPCFVAAQPKDSEGLDCLCEL